LNPRLSRRGFLIGATGAAVALVVRMEPWRAVVAYADPSDADRLVGLLTHVEQARTVGTAYLRAYPHDGSVGRLLDGIASRLPGGRAALRTSSGSELRRTVSASIRSDFERGATVRVQGWILARTEARLYALAALR
jgi:hypothetical protein